MKRGLSRRATVASTLVGMLLVVLALAFGAELNDAAAQEPQAASGKELEIRLHRQQTVAGVWAATIAMVTEYIQRIELTDCTVQSEYDMKFYFGRGLCCQNAPECQRYADLTEMPVIMNRISNIRGRYQMGPLPFNRIVQLIDDDKPVIAALAGPGGRGGHLVGSGGPSPERGPAILQHKQGVPGSQFSRVGVTRRDPMASRLAGAAQPGAWRGRGNGRITKGGHRSLVFGLSSVRATP